MDFEDAQYYVSETGQFVSYEEFIKSFIEELDMIKEYYDSVHE